MNMLLYVFPLVIAYAVYRGVMHVRAGRKMWAAQFFILSAFIACIFAFELWIKFKPTD